MGRRTSPPTARSRRGSWTTASPSRKVDTADLPYYATSQAVEDLDAIRQYLEVDKLDLYGESYGTQYVQTYAAAHPDHIRALYIDGPVDLTIDGPTWYTESSRAANDTLVAALASCTADAACAAAVQGGDAVASTTRWRPS